MFLSRLTFMPTCACKVHALEAKGYGIEILVERELVVELAIGYRITPKGPA